jgi:hypothetical protein
MNYEAVKAFTAEDHEVEKSDAGQTRQIKSSFTWNNTLNMISLGQMSISTVLIVYVVIFANCVGWSDYLDAVCSDGTRYKSERWRDDSYQHLYWSNVQTFV